MKLVDLKTAKYKLALAFAIFGMAHLSIAADVSLLSMVSKAGAETAPNAADLLDPKEAFRPKIRIRDPFTAELTVTIAPGYYLYRDRLRVDWVEHVAAGKPKPPVKNAAATSKQRLALSIPSGKPVDDPTFGKVEVFENSVTLLVDLSRFQQAMAQDNPGSLTLAFISQGCAIAGVCFPPQSQGFLLPFKTTKTADNWVVPQTETSLRFNQSGLNAKPASTRLFATRPTEDK